MSNVQATWVPFSEVVAPGRAGRRDLRWLLTGALVLGFTSLGTLFSFATRYWLWEYSFSARIAIIYLPAAIFLTLCIGWSPRLFPVAAGLFYAYLPISQAVSATWFVAGDVNGAITTEMILAIPLIITGFFGPADDTPRRRPLPPTLSAGWVLILVTGAISTMTAISPSTAAWTYVSRFIWPVLVTLSVYRRVRGLDDLRVLTYGLILGTLAVLAFGFERQVEGGSSLASLSGEVSQRSEGVSVSSAVPALYVMGLALWLARARAEKSAIFRAALWLALAGLMPTLFWLGAHRAPLVFSALLTLAWLPRSIRLISSRPLMLVPIAVGVIAALYLARYSVEKTTADTRFVIDRLKELASEGFTGHDRVEVWNIAIDGWLRSPVSGAGLNNCVVVNSFYMNLHSSILAALFDVGLLGVGAFLMVIIPVLRMNRQQLTQGLSREDQHFFYGHLAAWLVLESMLLVDLPVTSGQPKNNILVYLTYLYPLLAMKLYVHSMAREVRASPPSWNPLPAPPPHMAAAPAASSAQASVVTSVASSSTKPTGHG